MLRQEWFYDMEMVFEYYDIQVFYDEKVDCAYIVTSDEEGNITIKQIEDAKEKCELYGSDWGRFL